MTVSKLDRLHIGKEREREGGRSQFTQRRESLGHYNTFNTVCAKGLNLKAAFIDEKYLGKCT
jgi:hypothetical protein